MMQVSSPRSITQVSWPSGCVCAGTSCPWPHAADGDAGEGGDAQFRDGGPVRAETDRPEGMQDALAHKGESFTAQCLQLGWRECGSKLA
jgi:hypothetical protein